MQTALLLALERNQTELVDYLITVLIKDNLPFNKNDEIAQKNVIKLMRFIERADMARVRRVVVVDRFLSLPLNDEAYAACLEAYR